ncbi:MAG: peptidylprolyl isomerase [Bacteroidales bacterium]
MRTFVKKLLLSSTMMCGAIHGFAQEDPTVIRIGDQDVKLSEFEYIYKKNAGVQGVEKVSFDEYVKMFTDFKLKVHEALELRLDTLPQLQHELSGYRQQLAQSYLTDKEVDERLLREAYSRMNENVEVSHILLMLPEGATPKDTSEIYNKINGLYNRAVNGEDFAALAKEYSSCPSKKDGGYLGYLKAFMTVYPFESCAYNTPVGEISKPVRTQFGYHIVKVHNKRADQGTITLAHIFKQFRYNSSDEQKTSMINELKDLKAQLENGAGFDDLAKEYSDDSRTRNRGGVLPPFSVGEVPSEVFDTGVALQYPGDLSDVVVTGQGAHIFKLVRKEKIGSYEEEKERLQQMIMRDIRSNTGKQAFVDKLKKEYNVTVNPELIENLLTADSEEVIREKASSIKKPLLTIGTTIYSVSDYINYLNTVSGGYPLSRKLEALVDNYVSKSIMDYESARLDDKYPAFRNLMQEYRDGVLLFEISNRRVWDKAGQDTEGLEQFFLKNKKKYKLSEPHFKGYVVECSKDSVINEVKALLNENYSDTIVTHVRRKFNVKENIVKVQRVMAKRGDNPIVDQMMFDGKEYVPAAEYPYMFVQGKMLSDYPESYLDVRGAVTADYQDYLDRNWLKELNSKYKVKVNRKIIKTVKE